MMGGSNGGHHTKWMVESYPDLYDGGIAGYGFNSQVSQWGSIATVLRNYDVIAPRIDDIIAKRASDPRVGSLATALTPPLTAEQLRALQHIYEIPATLQNGFAFNVGRWKGPRRGGRASTTRLLGYLRDSMPRFDETFNPGGGPLTDDELKLWDPSKSPKLFRTELRKLDLSGNLKRPIIIMHGTSDPIVSPGESRGLPAAGRRRLGAGNAAQVLAVYFIPGMGHGGAEYEHLIGAQIDALEAMDRLSSEPRQAGAPAPQSLGGFARRGL